MSDAMGSVPALLKLRDDDLRPMLMGMAKKKLSPEDYKLIARAF